MKFTENFDKWTMKIWLNSVLDYCLGCGSQYVREGAAWWRLLCRFISLFAQNYLIKVLICLSLVPLAFSYFSISTGIVDLTWVLPFILPSEPVINVHESNPDSKSQNSTQSRIGPVWQQDRSIQMDHSKQHVGPHVGKCDRQDETIDRREVVGALFYQNTSGFNYQAVIKAASQGAAVVSCREWYPVVFFSLLNPDSNIYIFFTIWR